MIFLLLLLLFSNNKTKTSEDTCRNLLFLLAFLFICNTNKYYINSVINFTSEPFFVTNISKKTHTPFNMQSPTQKFNNLNYTYKKPVYPIDLNPNFEKLRMYPHKKNNTKTISNEISLIENKSSSTPTDTDVKFNTTCKKTNTVNPTSLKSIKNPTPDITSLIIKNSSKSMNTEDNIHNKNNNSSLINKNTLPNIIKNNYRGSPISILVNGFGVVTGEIIFNYTDITVLKLKNNITLFINNDYIANFF